MLGVRVPLPVLMEGKLKVSVRFGIPMAVKRRGSTPLSSAVTWKVTPLGTEPVSKAVWTRKGLGIETSAFRCGLGFLEGIAGVVLAPGCYPGRRVSGAGSTPVPSAMGPSSSGKTLRSHRRNGSSNLPGSTIHNTRRFIMKVRGTLELIFADFVPVAQLDRARTS